MSYELQVKAEHCPSASQLREALGLSDLGGMPEDLSEKWQEQGLYLFRRNVSTRLTSVAWVDDHVEVTVRASAAPEDCELALRVVEAVAELGGAHEIESEDFGTVALTQLRELHGTDWSERQTRTGASSIAALIDDGRGPISMAGPVREIFIGSRMLRELREAGPAAELPTRMLAEMRRVQWAVPSQYRTAGVFLARPKHDQGKQTKLVIWLPDEHLVLSKVDHVALRAGENDTVLVPFDALPELAAGVGEPLDECQWLVRPASANDWARIVARAREIRGS
jgi:hypothetical protein